jgi:hypothetical protein
MGLRSQRLSPGVRATSRSLLRLKEIMRLVESNGARLPVHGAGRTATRRDDGGCRFVSVTGGCVALRPRLSPRGGIEDSDAPPGMA